MITSIVVLPVVLVATYLGGLPFTLLAGGLALFGLLEFYLLAEGRPEQGSPVIGVPMYIVVVIGFHFQENWLIFGAVIVGCVIVFLWELLRNKGNLRRSVLQSAMTLAGVLYLGFPTGFMISTRALPITGIYWLLVIFALTWGTDTLAYIGGRLWGKRKLAPTISPKKTVEGAIVGIFGGWTPALIVLGLNGLISAGSVFIVAIGPFMAIIGDLFESMMKRWFGVKDSHIRGLDILPGHGGVLDRVDSLVFVTTFVYLTIRLFQLA